MDISSYLPFTRELVKAGMEHGGDAVQAIHPDHENQGYRQQGEDNHDLALAIKAQPLQLVVRAIIEKINELFEVQGHHHPVLSNLELTVSTAAQQIIQHLSEAYSTFRQRFNSTNEQDIMQRFTVLAEQTLHQGMMEARTILASLNLYDDTLAMQLDQVKELIDHGLEYLQAQAS